MKVELRGRFKVEHWRDGKLLSVIKDHNDITNEGLDALLDTMFHNDTQVNPWYIGLVDNNGFSAFAAADTLASHAGWTEFTSYTGNRLDWGEDAASGQSITNSAVVTFPITASGTLKGIMIASVATGSSGTLWSTGPFDDASTPTVANGDNIKITYALDAAAA